MNPIEKARELAHCDTCDTCDNSNYLIPSKNCILKIDLSIAMQMHEWTKQQMIEKACEWLHDNAKNYIDYTEEGEIAFSENDMVINFKKAMEEQL